MSTKEIRQEIAQHLADDSAIQALNFSVVGYRAMPEERPYTLHLTTLGTLSNTIHSLGGGSLAPQIRFTLVGRVKHDNTAAGLEGAEDILDDLEDAIDSALAMVMGKTNLWQRLRFYQVSQRPGDHPTMQNTRLLQMYIQVNL